MRNGTTQRSSCMCYQLIAVAAGQVFYYCFILCILVCATFLLSFLQHAAMLSAVLATAFLSV